MQNAAPQFETGVIRTVPFDAIRISPEYETLYGPIDPDDPEVQELAKSIREHGTFDPVSVTLDGYILNGHRRYLAAQLAGRDGVAVRGVLVRRADDPVRFEQRLRTILWRPDEFGPDSEWLRQLDERMYAVCREIGSGAALASIQQTCNALFDDCTDAPWKAEEGPRPFHPPRFLAAGSKDWGECQFAFNVYDIADERGYYFKQAFQRMMEFIATPVPLATQLKESLACYLKLRGYDVAGEDGPPDDAIISHGNRVYGVERSDPISLTENEDNVLSAFLECSALDLESLVRTSGVPNARNVLRSLTTKYAGIFASAITLPGGKGRGGYRVRIRRAE